MKKRTENAQRAPRWLGLLAACALIFGLAPGAAADSGPAVASEAYFVMDAATGQVLLAKNADEELDPASVTKIMTLGLACEKAQGDWTQQLTVTHDDVYSLYGTDSSHIALAEGEVVTLEQMLYATGMASANDAANVLAEYIGGTIDGGVAAMNDQAAALGLAHTHFSNPHGISSDDHYTSARDLAEILYWAKQQPGFMDVFTNTAMYTMPGTNVHPETRYFSIQDAMRRQPTIYYIPEITGSKIGYTNVARYTYACTAEKDGVELIITLMRSEMKPDKYADMRTLTDYCFSHFRHVTLPAVSAGEVAVQGGGEPLGTVPAEAAQTVVTLDTALADSAAVLDMAGGSYTLGGAAPVAHYTIAGGGVQEDSVVDAALTLSGLDALSENLPDEPLPAAGVERKIYQREQLGPQIARIALWCLGAAAAAGAVLFCMHLAHTGAQAGKKRLRKNTK